MDLDTRKAMVKFAGDISEGIAKANMDKYSNKDQAFVDGLMTGLYTAVATLSELIQSVETLEEFTLLANPSRMLATVALGDYK